MVEQSSKELCFDLWQTSDQKAMKVKKPQVFLFDDEDDKSP